MVLVLHQPLHHDGISTYSFRLGEKGFQLYAIQFRMRIQALEQLRDRVAPHVGQVLLEDLLDLVIMMNHVLVPTHQLDQLLQVVLTLIVEDL